VIPVREFAFLRTCILYCYVRNNIKTIILQSF